MYIYGLDLPFTSRSVIADRVGYKIYSKSMNVIIGIFGIYLIQKDDVFIKSATIRMWY